MHGEDHELSSPLVGRGGIRFANLAGFGEVAVKRYVRESTSAGMFITNMFSNAVDAKNWLKEVQAVVPH